jgi:predicted nucleic acid-binding Zn ribbon protein
MKRLLSAPAFQFKGTGWYVTDYAKKSGSGDSASSEPKREKSESGSSETPKKKETSDSSSKKSD